MTDGAAPRLEMRAVCKQYGATVALDDVSLSIMPGVVHALVGENGAGKSTLMKVLSGAITADNGEMRLDGEAYHPRHPMDARQSGVAMIYQELSLAHHLSVEDNITLGMEPNSIGILKRREIRQRALDALEQLGHPEIEPGQLAGSLTVAAQQLVEIGRAVAIGCRVLVLDEPTSSLSREDVDRLFKLIAKLKEQGKSIVYISHFLEEVKQVADRFTVLRDGKSVYTGDIASSSSEQIVSLMVGRDLKELYPRSKKSTGDVVLEIKQLAGITKPAAASLSLHRGEVLGIAGLVGAGRTELLRAIFGLDSVKSGDVRVGTYFGSASPARRWKQGVGMLSEDRKNEGLALSLSIADNLTLSKLDGLGPGPIVLPGQQETAATTWIKRLGIKCKHPAQPVSDLSGGNQQKVALGRLLHHDVDVLLLDEPTRGIDVASKALIYQIIDELAAGCADKGIAPKAVLIVSSYLPELMGICDRVAVMHRGRLGPARPVEELHEQQIMLEATGAGETL